MKMRCTLLCALQLVCSGGSVLFGQVSMLVANHETLAAAVTYIQSDKTVAQPAPGAQVLGVGGSSGPNGAQCAEPLPPPAIRPQTHSEPLPEASAGPGQTRTAVVPVARFEEDEIPSDAIKPDGSGSIVLTSRKAKSGAQVQLVSPHNPWGVRVATKETMLTYTLRLDGLIVGDPDNTKLKPEYHATALINGTPVHKGDTQAGPFTLQGIRRHEVILEYDGTLFVIPESRVITVRIPRT